MRKETRELLQLEEKHFNGVISRLKKKKFLGKPILNEKNIIHSELLFKPDSEGFRIEITLKNTPNVSYQKKSVELPPEEEPEQVEVTIDLPQKEE